MAASCTARAQESSRPRCGAGARGREDSSMGAHAFSPGDRACFGSRRAGQVARMELVDMHWAKALPRVPVLRAGGGRATYARGMNGRLIPGVGRRPSEMPLPEMLRDPEEAKAARRHGSACPRRASRAMARSRSSPSNIDQTTQERSRIVARPVRARRCCRPELLPSPPVDRWHSALGAAFGNVGLYRALTETLGPVRSSEGRRARRPTLRFGHDLRGRRRVEWPG
jgi:hypothetical protein